MTSTVVAHTHVPQRQSQSPPSGNPLEGVVDAAASAAQRVYNDYLYASGTMLMLWCAWSVYPSMARWRHAHVARYTRRQVEQRCRLFATAHLPRWRTSLLEQLIVPCSTEHMWCAQASEPHLLRSASAASGCAVVAPPKPLQDVCHRRQSARDDVTADSSISDNNSNHDDDSNHSHDVDNVRGDDDGEGNAACMRVRLVVCAYTTFANPEAAEVCRQLRDRIEQVNATLAAYEKAIVATAAASADTAAAGTAATTPATLETQRGATHKLHDALVHTLHRQLRRAVTQSGAVVVKRTVRHAYDDDGVALPHTAEVWWLSVAEAQRRRRCLAWALVLAVARILQDAFYMPDMPVT